MVSVTARRLAGLLVAALGLPGLARAQEASAMDGVMEAFHLKAKLAPAPPFVTQSRPTRETGFIPVGTPHPARPGRIMSAAEVAATEADLDASRERQQRRAGRRPAVVPLKGAKPPTKATVP